MLIETTITNPTRAYTARVYVTPERDKERQDLPYPLPREEHESDAG